MGIPSYGVDYEGQYDFLQIGTITSAQAALAVTARDNASVVDLAAAKKVIWSPDQGTAAAILRFRTDGTEDDAPVIQMYGAKGADYYTRIATLTLAQGTQDWSGGHFVDEITLSNEAWAHGIRANSVTDEVGRVVFNTGGFDRFLFIASTLAVTTIHIDIARLDKQIDHGIEIHSAILVLADNMTVSDVVSAISDMHSDVTAQNDSIINDLDSIEQYAESCANDLESITALQNSVADNTRSCVVELQSVNADIVSVHSAILAQDSAISAELETIDSHIIGQLKSAVDDIATAVVNQDSALSDQLSGIEVDIEATNTKLDTVESSLDSIETDIEAIETTLNTVSGHTTSITVLQNSIADNTRSCVVELQSVNADIVSVHSQAVLIKTAVDLVRSTLSDTIATDLTDMQNQLSSVMTDLDGIRAAVSDMDSAQSDAMATLEADVVSCHSQLVLNVAEVTGVRSGNLSAATLLDGDIDAVRSGNLSAATRITTEVSDAISQLKDTLNFSNANSSYNAVEELSGIHSEIKAQADASAQLSSLITAQDETTTAVSNNTSVLSNAISQNEGGIRSGVKSAMIVNEAGIRSGVKSAVTSAIGALMDGENISDLVDAVELVTTEVSTATSNLKTAVNLVTTEVSDAISNLKDAVAAADATSAVLAMDSAQSGMFSTLEVDVETVNTNLSGIESIADRTFISAGTPSVLWISDIASAADATRAIVDSAVDAIDEVKSAVLALDSAQSGFFSVLQTAIVAEVSDAISNLKSMLTITQSDILSALQT